MLLTHGLVIWLLIFIRLGAMMTMVPLFGARNVPGQLKVIFLGLLALSFTTLQNFQVGISLDNWNEITLGFIFEGINGLTIGFVVVAIMNAVYLGGHIIDMDMGFGMVNVISAQDEGEMPITANFYYLMVMVIFVITNAHHYLILAFARSIQMTPLGMLSFNGLIVDSYFMLIHETFVIGFQLAMPIIIVILIANIVLGLLSKAMPGMNVFMVGMPFKILIGLMTLVIMFPFTADLLFHLIERMTEYIDRILEMMRITL